MRRFVVSSLAIAGLILSTTLVRAADEPKAIVEKAIKAMGGLEKLSKHKASMVKAKGSVEIMGMSIPWKGEFMVQFPGQRKMEIDMDIMGNAFKFVQVLDGDKAWQVAMGTTDEVTGDKLAALKFEAYVSRVETLAPLLTEQEFTLSSLGEAKVAEKPALGVKVSCKGQKDVNLYFDKDTGLLVKTERRALDPMEQEVTAETIYSDYKELEGLKHAMKFEIRHEGKKFLDSETIEVKLLPKLDTGVFAKP